MVRNGLSILTHSDLERPISSIEDFVRATLAPRGQRRDTDDGVARHCDIDRNRRGSR
jgi:hypothetical protein